MELQVNVGAVADEDTVADSLEALLFEISQLTPEGLQVEDNTGADEVDAAGVDQAGREKVEATVSQRRQFDVGSFHVGSHTGRRHRRR